MRLGAVRSVRRACRGAVAIEFALVFLIFFGVFYAIVAYGLVFTMEQSMTMAAEEGARAALQNAPDEATRLARAQTTAVNSMSWFTGAGLAVPLPTADDCADADPATRCVTVSVTYNNAANPLVPSLPWLGIVIPDTLGATARVQYIQY